MSGGPVSVSGPHPPIGTTPRLAPKARTGRQADPRRSPHQGPGGASLPAPSIRKRAEPGVSAKPPPPKNGRQRPNGIRAWTSPTPFHPKRTENRRLRQRPQTEEKEGRRGRRGRRKGRRKGGRKPESRKAEKLGSRKPESGEAGKRGSREAGKPGSREAGKRGSREAGGGIKKRRRTVGCTSACGSQQSLAYRNYLLR